MGIYRSRIVEREKPDMKKTLLLIVATILTLSLSACGGSTVQASSTTTESNSQASSAAETTAPTPEPTPEVKENWVIQTGVDEFGDKVETDIKTLATICSGTFSNSATTSSSLSTVVTFCDYGNGEQPIFFFTLSEYNSHPVSLSSYETADIKFKVDNTVYEHRLFGNENLLALNAMAEAAALGTKVNYSGSDGFSEMYEALAAGKDVRCIITISSDYTTTPSKYNFTIEAGNFLQGCIDIGYAKVVG